MRRVVRRLLNSRHITKFQTCYQRQQFSNKDAGEFPFSYQLLSRQAFFSTLCNRLNSDPSFLSLEIDSGFDIPTQTLDTVLERARAHGITTLEQLAVEADFGSRISRLANDRSIRQDLDYWAILLDFRQIQDGPSGIQDVLKSMLRDGQPVKLYADSLSSYIWRQILPIAVNDEKLLHELCQTGSSFMQHRPLVFADIIGQLLAKDNIRLAIVFGTQLLSSLFQGQSDILRLFDVTLHLGSVKALHNFCQLISRLPRYQLYKEIIPKLWRKGRKQHAYILHRHLLSLGDYPTSFEEIEPFIEDIASRRLKFEPFLRDMERHDISFSHQARRFYTQEKARISRGGKMMEFHSKSGPGTRPVKLSDAFVARTFATQSVSFEFVLSGLRFIGLYEVGPLAMRELALSANGTNELRRRFELLDSAEIDVGSSKFTRILKNACLAGNDELLATTLRSDMHYEVFEDTQKQKRLLTEYAADQNRQKNELDRTLTILNDGRSGANMDSQAAQLLLQSALVKGDWRQVLMILDGARGLHQDLAQYTELAPLRFAMKRVEGYGGIAAQDDDYISRESYMVGFMQLAAAAGYPVRLWQWRTTLYSVGRLRDWSFFSRLLLSVARLSRSDVLSPVTYEQTNTTEKVSATDQLLDASFQAFIIEASLVCGSSTDNPSYLWHRAVELLYILRDRFQADISYETVSNAVQNRLQELFEGMGHPVPLHIVQRYLKCLKWAWIQNATKDSDRLLAKDKDATVPDEMSVKLLQIRSKLVWLRRTSYDMNHMTRTGQWSLQSQGRQNHPRSRSRANTYQKLPAYDAFDEERFVKTGDEAIVFYEDIMHPSYKKN